MLLSWVCKFTNVSTTCDRPVSGHWSFHVLCGVFRKWVFRCAFGALCHLYACLDLIVTKLPTFRMPSSFLCICYLLVKILPFLIIQCKAYLCPAHFFKCLNLRCSGGMLWYFSYYLWPCPFGVRHDVTVDLIQEKWNGKNSALVLPISTRMT